MTMIRVGMMVVCVDDAPGGSAFVPGMVTKGQVYVVRGVADESWVGGFGLYIEEATLGPCGCQCGKEVPFRGSRFRLVKATDISELRRIATSVRVGAGARGGRASLPLVIQYFDVEGALPAASRLAPLVTAVVRRFAPWGRA